MVRLFSSVSVLLLLTACAAPTTRFQNAAGQIATCSSMGYGWLGAPMALASHADCVDRMRAAGYWEAAEGDVNPKSSEQAHKLWLDLPQEWEKRSPTDKMVEIGVVFYAINKTMDAGALVSAVDRESITNLMDFASARRTVQARNLKNPKQSEITRTEIDGRMAFRFEISGVLRNGVDVTYLNTLIVGEKQIAYINTWTKAVDYPQHKPTLESLASNLKGLD
jgi:hypothetical protein